MPFSRSRVLLLLLLLLLLPATGRAAPPAQEGEQEAGVNRAALVIRSGDDQVDSYCVSFAEQEITGYELLARAGRVALVRDVGMGVTVCQIDQVGCPPGNCFCQCQGDPCVYWSYWHRPQDQWQYAVVGASTYRVQPGAVEGWSWGPGSVTEAIPPPPLSFEDVCAPPVAEVEPTTAATPLVGADPATGDPVATGAAPVATAVPVATAAPVAAERAPGTAGWLYALFLLIILGLGGALWWFRRREAA